MKPVIYSLPKDSRVSWLVDEDSRTTWLEEISKEHIPHYETSILVMNLKPGFFCLSTVSPDLQFCGDYVTPPHRINPDVFQLWKKSYLAPYPSVIGCFAELQRSEFIRPYATDMPEAWNGIYKKAAEVMLKLAASYQNIQGNRVKQTYAFGGARTEKTDPSLPWDEWAFICAWLWSDWETRNRREKITLAKRFEEMQAAGYPNKFKAFAALHRRLFP